MLSKVSTFLQIDSKLRPVLVKEMKAAWLGKRSNGMSLGESIEACQRWLLSAHRATGEKGVAALYSLTTGYAKAYPETTGYIVPSLIDYGREFQNSRTLTAAKACADWLCDIQEPSGAIQAGYIGMNLPGCVFNTGMALFGFAAAYEQFQEKKYAEAGRRAAEWLISCMNEAGCFDKNLSTFAEDKPFHTYNVRVAFALARFGVLDGAEDFKQAAGRNLAWTLSQSNDQGFFTGCEMAKFAQPLTHTIAYTLRGVLETGLLLDEQPAIDKVLVGLRVLAERQRLNGGFAGLYDASWNEAAKWDCLTGTAQIAILFAKAYQATKEALYLTSYERSIAWLRRQQVNYGLASEVHGGLFGSYPIYGGYHPYSIPNWAVKFLLDALLIDKELR